mgnify:CR=1 FL=1
MPLFEGSVPSCVSSPDSPVRTEENIPLVSDPSDTQSIGLTYTRRETRLPSKFIDYIVEGKYTYLNLISENTCFVSNLDKTFES